MIDRERAQIVDRFRREPVVRINGDSLAVDTQGRFATQVDAGAEAIDVVVRDAEGRTVHSTVPLPDVEIL